LSSHAVTNTASPRRTSLPIPVNLSRFAILGAMRALAALALSVLVATPSGGDELTERIQKLEDDLKATQEQLKQVQPVVGRLSGYLDFGFFRVAGAGSGIRPALGNVNFPEYANVIPNGTWVFMGDPLSTMINARGEPADTGPSRAI